MREVFSKKTRIILSILLIGGTITLLFLFFEYQVNEIDKPINRESLRQLYQATRAYSPFIDEENVGKFEEAHEDSLNELKEAENRLDLLEIFEGLVANIGDGGAFIKPDENSLVIGEASLDTSRDIYQKERLVSFSGAFLYDFDTYQVLKIYDWDSDQFQSQFEKSVGPKLNEKKDLIIDISYSNGSRLENCLYLLEQISRFRDYVSIQAQYRVNLKGIEGVQNDERDFSFAPAELEPLIEKSEESGEFWALDTFEAPVNLSEDPGLFNYESLYLVTDRQTKGAGEIFAYYAKQNPNIVLVGKNTGGSTGDLIEYALSNRYKLYLPVTQYLDEEGKTINDQGIRPEIEYDIKYKSRKTPLSVDYENLIENVDEVQIER